MLNWHPLAKTNTVPGNQHRCYGLKLVYAELACPWRGLYADQAQKKPVAWPFAQAAFEKKANCEDGIFVIWILARGVACCRDYRWQQQQRRCVWRRRHGVFSPRSWRRPWARWLISPVACSVNITPQLPIKNISPFFSPTGQKPELCPFVYFVDNKCLDKLFCAVAQNKIILRPRKRCKNVARKQFTWEPQFLSQTEATQFHPKQHNRFNYLFACSQKRRNQFFLWNLGFCRSW